MRMILWLKRRKKKKDSIFSFSSIICSNKEQAFGLEDNHIFNFSRGIQLSKDIFVVIDRNVKMSVNNK